MKPFATLVLAAGALAAGAAHAEEKKMAGPLDFKLPGIDGKDLDLAQYKGKVVLLVNVASQCGYTPQYAGLQELYGKYGKDGLVVIGVPANDFGKQEPGTNDDIQKFCKTNYKVGFPMAAKQVVVGAGQTPLYAFLTGKDSDPKFAGDVKWNFEKFLVNRKGEVVGRYKSGVEPTSDQLVGDIRKELDAK